MYNPQEVETEILKFWKNKKIYEKSKKKNLDGKKFYLMDGPPYATGHIHMGTALNKILKDIIMRSRRLQGYSVFDKSGYDTHGVPIEYQIEKEIGTKSKKDIEIYGIKKFIEKCKEFATKYIGVMNSEFENLGIWMDFDNPYLTLDNKYIETIWDTFKVADEKGLLYLGKYPVHVCPRCETAVAYNEIEYAKLEDNSIYVKFPLKDKKNKFLIIMTTTAWTLPGNTGIMVNPDIEYVEAELSNGEIWIIAKEKVSELMSAIQTGYTIKKTIKGKELEGLKYENPLSKNLRLKVKNGYKVILSARYVNIEEGTGLVHAAPGHGKEDYEVGKEYGIDMPSPVDVNGILTEEAGKYAGKKARVVDAEIIEDLEKDGFLVYKQKYTHDYPLCWRCKSPLLMLSRPQWFFKIDKIQEKILKENEETNWIPKYMKLRMKSWLEGISDWPISRNRYWGTPLPIWICDKCKEKQVIGSINELEKKSGKKIKEVHKPEIDEIKWKCKCNGEMKRVPEVLDVWFDSGVSSWAALEYPQKQVLFKKFWPADINIEGKDQIRGWWNSQIILSEIKFNKKPFENISVHGMILDLGKRKMSKSIGNIISPQDIIKNYGRDYMRYYFAKISKGEDFAFDEQEFKQIKQSFIILENVINYINNLSGSEKGSLENEDKWIISKFNSALNEIVNAYNEYNLPRVIELFEDFLLSELSRTYIKIIRERENEKIIKTTLNKIIVELLKLIAPVAPLITEKIWQEFKENKIVKEESIHLSSLPKPNKKLIDAKLERNMQLIKEVIQSILAEREKVQINIRWPLSKAVITTKNKDIITAVKQLKEIIQNQCNIKNILTEERDISSIEVKLDAALTKELEQEGYARELTRKIQDLRKKSGLKKQDRIELAIKTSYDLGKFADELKEKVGAKKLSAEAKKKYQFASVEKIKEQEFEIMFNKL